MEVDKLEEIQREIMIINRLTVIYLNPAKCFDRALLKSLENVITASQNRISTLKQEIKK